MQIDLPEAILKSIASRHREPHRHYIGASSVGKECRRALWYSYHNAPSTEFSPTVKATFDIGKRLEGLILDYVELAGFKLIRPSEFNHDLFCADDDVQAFQGHMDAIIALPDGEHIVLEIKTAKSSRFQMFKKNGLKQWSPEYYAQIQSYLGMMGFARGVLLAVNKDTSELHQEIIDFDPYFYNELKAKAEGIIHAEEPPERINKSPLFIVCARCNYKDTCFFGETK